MIKLLIIAVIGLILFFFAVTEYEYNCDLFKTTIKYKLYVTGIIIVGLLFLQQMLLITYEEDVKRYSPYKYEISLQQGKYEEEYYTNNYQIEGTYIKFTDMYGNNVVGSEFRVERNSYYGE